MNELPARAWIVDSHFLVLDCPDELRRASIIAALSGAAATLKSKSTGRWLRDNINDRVDTSNGSPETADAITAWIDRISSTANRYCNRKLPKMPKMEPIVIDTNP